MRLSPWVREVVDGYRWLWRAELRWGTSPRWLAPLRFAARVSMDVVHATLCMLTQAPRVGAAPAGWPTSRRIAMTVPHSALALEVLEPSANERLKATFDSSFWTAMIAATVVHFGTFALWPTLTAADVRIDRTALTTLELPPDVTIPEAPKELPRPAAPIMATTDVPVDVTIGLTTFEENPVSELPPPPTALETSGSTGVTFTPFTVAPAILNTDEVVRAMGREYPAVLRDAGIGGTVRVNFFIDGEGRVLETRIQEGSSYAGLDQAALAVADVIRFSPALNRDQTVAVWVVFPIVFRVDDRED